MNVFGRIRAFLLPDTLPDTTERNIRAAQSGSDAADAMQSANALMEKWSPERAEDLRRMNRTGDPVYGWVVPEGPEGSDPQ